MQGRDAVAPQQFEPLSTALLVQPIAIATLSVCIALLCLSQSESLTGPSVNLHNLKNTTCQILPCPTQPSPSKLCVQCVLSTRPRIPTQFLFLLVHGGHRSPHTHILAAAQCARLRERGSTLCLCNTNHPAGPRIRKQDPWELEGHGQYVPPRLPPPQASISYATYGILYATILCTTS